MAVHLPDEILSEILAPALRVPDSAFADNSRGASPFANYTESTSAYLVVCKSWLRVATPLLYHVVVLRSQAQAKALATALSRNEQLGHFVKKLRVEGGFGISMHTVLSRIPNVTDLYLSLDIISPEKTEGLCKGLRLISPTRLILQCHEHKPLQNKHYLALIEELHRVIPKWDRLVALAAADNIFNEQHNAILSCLDACKRIQSLTTLRSPGVVSIVRKLANCPIREVHIRAPMTAVDLAICASHSELRKLSVSAPILLPPKPEPIETVALPPSLDPSFTPMADVSNEIRDLVWSRVLQLAMSAQGRQPSRGSQKRLKHQKLPFLLVSREFYRLGLPLFYTDVVLRRTRNPVDLLTVLRSRPDLGACILNISGRGYATMEPDPELASLFEIDISSDESWGPDRGRGVPGSRPVRADDAREAILEVIPHLTRLQQFTLFAIRGHRQPIDTLTISWDTIERLGRVAGASLRELSISVFGSGSGEKVLPTIFASFTRLETLRWKGCVAFDLDKADPDVLAPGLPLLCELEVRDADPSLFDVLAVIKPPRLQRFVVRQGVDGSACTAFMRECGPTIEHLDVPIEFVNSLTSSVLDSCSRLVTLKLSWLEFECEDLPSPQVLSPNNTAECLQKVIIVADVRSPHADISPAQWAKYFTQLPFEKSLPALRELHFRSLEWPTSQREINKDPWVRLAESLLEQNVGMVDRNGIKWRSRLKLKRGSRK
ncbi:hypothetical protein HMN09_00554200 [Mycena chlorophos]|uniref:Uncharacterized protein n=1 Tax=Mycena chlorophos TaxID=658473 RepID=A0A8H6TA83_MYCCL|nr:hypothetical protein HMN09_00554200 [Mycena chlorophos]